MRQNVYTIARIVVFKDDPLATARPDLAVKQRHGRVVSRPRGAGAGSIPRGTRSGTTTSRSRSRRRRRASTRSSSTTCGFPTQAGRASRRRTRSRRGRRRSPASSRCRAAAPRRPTTCSSPSTSSAMSAGTWTTPISASASRISLPRVDYLSPMLYPSGFQFGIPGLSQSGGASVRDRPPLARQNARERSAIPRPLSPVAAGVSRLCVRPARVRRRRRFGSRFGGREFGSDGWMLWNPRNIYTDAGLKIEGKACRDAPPE